MTQNHLIDLKWLVRNKTNKKSKMGTDRPTNLPTDRQTDQPTDKAGYRVACTRIKTRPIAISRVLRAFSDGPTDRVAYGVACTQLKNQKTKKIRCWKNWFVKNGFWKMQNLFLVCQTIISCLKNKSFFAYLFFSNFNCILAYNNAC